MRRLLPLLLAAAALVAAGCGSSNDSSSSDATTQASPSSGGVDAGQGNTSTSTTSTAEADDTGGGHEVRIENFAFSPKNITVKVGQKIEWENYDGVAHNVVADSGAKFSSDALNKGDTFSFTPKKAGKITYECTFHPQMKGFTITVTG